MRTLAFVLALLAAPAAVEKAPAPGVTPVDDAPKFVVEKWLMEVGEVVRGEPVEVSFVVRNEGGQELRILQAKPT